MHDLLFGGGRRKGRGGGGWVEEGKGRRAGLEQAADKTFVNAP